ncbi:Cytidylate kinase [Liberibacter crescens BT-1]|uniref:Cytidylate kinase n=1 Tax=Liberibacter crescens (strain BT-1) TaxID=1215343 RepID=L0ERJ6_LIBCB|nr:(d)CMP kinase [Liberibacter crescens]AGA64104.1 Cytidylate kinase [Liberibacter crescens BT-1]AMC12386.1 cytidylate kinase [Liberibacter crescens]
MNHIIAIDGPAAAGKGVLASLVAEEYGFHRLDTGLVYRAVAKAVLDLGINLDDEVAVVQVIKGIDFSDLNRAVLSTYEIAGAASEIAVKPLVRRELIKIQRVFSLKKPGTVIDGRDIGTVVCPDAVVKLYVTASLKIRAERRHAEMVASGINVDYYTIYESIKQRDKRDKTRLLSPLIQDKGAYFINTTKMNVETMFKVAKRLIDTKLNRV